MPTNGALPLRMCKLFLLTVAPETKDSSFLLSQSNDSLLRSNSVFRNLRVRMRADIHSFLGGKPCWQLDRKTAVSGEQGSWSLLGGETPGPRRIV